MPSDEPRRIRATHLRAGDRLLVHRTDRVWDEPGRPWHGRPQAWPARTGAVDEARVERIVWVNTVLATGTVALIGLFTDVGVLVCSPGSAVWVRAGTPAVP